LSSRIRRRSPCFQLHPLRLARVSSSVTCSDTCLHPLHPVGPYMCTQQSPWTQT
jgi:hypothetical protein